MIKTDLLINKIQEDLFKNILTSDAKISCQMETLKNMKSIVMFYRDNWQVEFMPTEISEAEKCAAFYDVDNPAIKGLIKLAGDIGSFLSRMGLISKGP